MIRFIKGDIFSSKAQTLVATVNCVGIMGKGLAKEFRQRYHEMYKEYAKACKRGELQKGRLFIYKDLHTQIICFPTKDNWKEPSKYEFIEEGLRALANNYKKWNITSIAIPPLGCGMGGLEWSKVRSLIEKYLSKLPLDIEVYEPLETGDRIPIRNPFKNMDKIKLTPSSIFTGEMIRIARKAFPSNISIGRLLLQKIAFFSQIAGVPIKLKFEKYHLGPFDYRLKFNVDKLEGLYVRDESTTINRSTLVMLDENRWLRDVGKEHDLDIENVRNRIQRAINFLKNFSLHDIELLSSVLLAWVSLVSSGQSGSVEEVKEYIKNWKYSKFDSYQIEKAMEILTKYDWLNMPNENTNEPEQTKDLQFTNGD